MSQQSLRNWMKYGPLTSLVTHVRRIRRRLRRQPYNHVERFHPTPLDSDVLREQIALYPDNARLYFSLALAYLEPLLPDSTSAQASSGAGAGWAVSEQPGEDGMRARYALSCLRCAQSCNSEAYERIQLYQALIAARTGAPGKARRLAESLDPEELSDSESCLRNRILENLIARVPESAWPDAPEWRQAGERVAAMSPASLLIIGDNTANSACWAHEADYLLASEPVTGLRVEQVTIIRRSFSVGVGTSAEQETATKAGIRCEHWVTRTGIAGGER